MKEILFIETQKYPDVVGGAEVFDYYLAGDLSKSYNISYLSYSPWNNSKLIYHNVSRIKPFGIFTPFLIFLKLLKIRKKIKLIHIRYSRSKWLNYWPYLVMKKCFDIPYIITIHGGGLTPWIFEDFYKYFFRNAYKVTGISSLICEEYKKRANIDVLFTPPLLPFERSTKTKDIIRQEKGITLQADVFLIVGSLKHLKNPITVLKAINFIGKDYLKKNQLCFIFAGDGCLADEMKKYINEHVLNTHVHLLGYIRREKIHEYYAMADNYIVSSDFEGTPLGMLEAMFNGLTIIGSNVRGINNIIKDNDNGLTFKVNDYEELARKIKLISEDKLKAKKLGINAESDYFTRFDYSHVINFYSRLIEDLN